MRRKNLGARTFLANTGDCGLLDAYGSPVACVNDIMISEPRGGLVQWLRSNKAQVADGGLDVGETAVENNPRQNVVAGVGSIAGTAFSEAVWKESAAKDSPQVYNWAAARRA